jgi:hypothetical protein
MASKGQQIPLLVPRQGERRDINQMVLGPEMASNARNVLSFDGTVRPRPALTAKGFGSKIEGEAGSWWVNVLAADGDYEVSSVAYLGDVLLVSMQEPGTTNHKFKTSDDHGETWVDEALTTHPLDGVSSDYFHTIYESNGYVFFVDSNSHLWRASLGTWPTAGMTLSDLGRAYGKDTEGENDIDHMGVGRLLYEPTIDALFWSATTDLGGGAFVHNHICCTQNASTTADASAIDDGGDTIMLESAIEEAGNEDPPTNSTAVVWHVQPDRVIWGFGYASGSRQWGGMEAKDIDSGGADLVFSNGCGSEGAFWNIPSQIQRARDGGTLMEISDAIPSTRLAAAFDIGNDRLVVVVGNSIARLNILDVKTVETVLDKELFTHPEGKAFRVLAFAQTDTKLVFLAAEGPATDVDRLGQEADLARADVDIVCWQSPDLGTSWAKLANYPRPAAPASGNPEFSLMAAVNASLEQQFYNLRAPGDDTTYGVVNAFAASGDPVQLGEVTNMTQLDMDSTEGLIVVGTTTRIIGLDRGTDSWEEYTSAGSGAGDLHTPGYYPDTRMGGALGNNPVIFRGFQSGGRTYLMATNGETQPIVYHEDMNGGRARFMGEVPDDDDNYSSDPEEPAPNGTPAPVARCMAVAANRVLLGNLVGTSPYGIDVSSFNDMDRGWQGSVQLTLLGDTPGQIVAMNEISALQVAIYKTDAIYHAVAQVEFLGTAAPFRFELSKGGIVGPCSPMCVLRLPDGRQCYFARDGGVYVYDGVAPFDVGRHVRAMVQPDFDENEPGSAWGMIDPLRKLVWFFYRTKSGGLNKGIVLSIDQGDPWPAWTVVMPTGWQFTAGMRAFFFDDKVLGDLRDPMGTFGTATLGSFTSGYSEMVMGRANNSWFTQKWEDDGDFTDDGTPIDVLLDPGWTQPGQSVQFYTASEVYHLFSCPDPAQALYCKLRAQQVGGNVRESASVPLYSGRHIPVPIQIYPPGDDDGTPPPAPPPLSVGGLRSTAVPDLVVEPPPATTIPAGAFRAGSVIDTKRKTSHRITGVRFSPRFHGSITRSFSWGGATMIVMPRGER